MNRTIQDQLNIDIHKLMNTSDLDCDNNNVNAEAFEVSLDTSKQNGGSTALLEVDISQNSYTQFILPKAIAILTTEFPAMTIFIDQQLALLTYKIIMPYMNSEDIEAIVKQEKENWISKNIGSITKATAQWTIITGHESNIAANKHDKITQLKQLAKDDKEFMQHIKKDAEIVIKHILDQNNIVSKGHLQQLQQENIQNKAEDYIINKIATIAAIECFDNNKHICIGVQQYSSYGYIQRLQTLLYLPLHLTFEITKVTQHENSSRKLSTSTEINQNMSDYGLLEKLSTHKSYLESSFKHFMGHAYAYTLDGTFIGCNKQIGLSLGIYDKSYIDGKHFTHFYPEEESNKLIGITKEIVAADTSKTLIEDYCYPTSNKQVSFLSIKMPLRNNKNKVVGLIGFSAPTEDKEEIAKYRNNGDHNIMNDVMADNTHTENIGKMMEYMPGHVFWQDTNGKILGCNYSYAAFLGYDSPNDIIGKYHDAFLTTEHAQSAQQELSEMIATGEPISKEEIYKSNNSNFLVVISHKTPIKDSSSKVTGVMVVAIDISKNKQHVIKLEQEKEKLEIANNFKNQFIQDLEHDMRTPFVGLYNMTELYAEKETNSAKKKQLHEISSCAKELLTYCDSLLEFSKKESFANNKSSISIKDLTERMIRTSLTAIRAKGLEFELEYDDRIPEHLLGDSYRIRRIISNLMSNAIKYTEKGYIKLIIKLEQSTSDNITVSFLVVDSGIGISKEKQQQVFNKYIKHSSHSGQGLGLNEVKRFVEDLRGEIFITSDTNMGTSITVKLDFDLPSINHDEKNISPSYTSNKKILIVEDSRITVKFLEEIIKDIGYSSKEAATGEETLKLITNENFDMILLDIGLEDTDGYSLARKIREHELKTQRQATEIVIMTAQKSRINLELAHKLNIRDYFIKPVKVKELTDAIQTIMGSTTV